MWVSRVAADVDVPSRYGSRRVTLCVTGGPRRTSRVQLTRRDDASDFFLPPPPSMSELNLKFTTTPSTDNGSFKLLELPPEICKLVESAAQGEGR